MITVLGKFSIQVKFKEDGKICGRGREAVFSSLLKTWNAFSEVKISEEIRQKFCRIGISRFNFCSELCHFSGYKIFGSRGKSCNISRK